MRVLFISSASGNSRGGHVYSMFHIAKALAITNDLRIITIGKGDCPVYQGFQGYLGSFDISISSILKYKKQIHKLLDGFKPDVVNFFNEEHYLYCQAFNVFDKSIRQLVTKCGGKNPKGRRWIVSKNILCFSKENFSWFKQNPYYKKTAVFYLPNRLSSKILIEYDSTLLKNENVFNFLRIGRISEHYISSYLKLIDLVSSIKKKGIRVHLYIIGTVNNQDCFDLINKHIKSADIEVTIVIDQRTFNASRLLYLADCVLGTGRSAMESISLGIPTLVPAMNSNFPILLTEENVDYYLNTNFSERALATEQDLAMNYDFVLNIINKAAIRSNTDLRGWFNSNLSVEGLEAKYLKLYSELKREKGISLINVLYLIKQIRNLKYHE